MGTQLSPEEFKRYSRNILLPQVGIEGQLKLKESSILIVGLGGLGSPVALYLVAAGVGRLGLADPDKVELTNLQRQVLHTTTSIGQSKATSAYSRLAELNPEVKLEVLTSTVNTRNALDLISNYQYVVDATDNLVSRYLLNDACYLSHKPLIHGSIYRFEGQASVFDGQRGPCYRCVYPIPPPAKLVPSGSQIGVMGILPGMIGMIQATEAIKLMLGIPSSLFGTMLVYNAITLTFKKITLHKNPDCPLCGRQPSITKLKRGEYIRIGSLKE